MIARHGDPSSSGWRPSITASRSTLPGHGESDGPPRPLEDLAGAINQLLGELGIERPVVVGHSMGAGVAGLYAANHPASGVVVVDQPLLVSPFAELVQRLEPALRSENFRAAFEPIRQSIGVELLPEPQRSQIAASQRIQQDLVLGYWEETLRTTPDDLQARFDRAAQAISAPVLVVFGHALDLKARQHMLRCVPAAEIEEWPERGHMVHLVEPDRFAHRLAVLPSGAFRPHRQEPGTGYKSPAQQLLARELDDPVRDNVDLGDCRRVRTDQRPHRAPPRWGCHGVAARRASHGACGAR